MSRYITKKPRHEAAFWSDKHRHLEWFIMELTERCNNNCHHCYINQPASDRSLAARELSTAEIKDVLVQGTILGAILVRFTGGEPLLRDDFEEIYLFARSLGLKVMIYTNATLITPYLADLFARIPPLEKMEISVYGMTARTYESVTRNPGSFDAFWRGVNLLLEKRVPFVVKGAYLTMNKDEMDTFEKWATTIPWMDNPPGYSMFFCLRCRRDSEKKDSHIKHLRVSPQDGLTLLTRHPSRYHNNLYGLISSITGTRGDTLFGCGAGHRRFCIDSYGFIQPCLELRHRDCVLDIRHNSLQEALVDFFPKMRQRRATNPQYLERCGNCFLIDLCEQCPAYSWLENGILDSPVEYHCEITHKQAEYLGLIENGEKAWLIVNWKDRIQRFTKAGMMEEKVQ